MIRSLRFRLLLGTSLSSAVVLSLLGISIYVAMQHALMRDFDNSLRIEARLLSGMLEQDGQKTKFEFNPEQMPNFISDKHGRYFEIWRADGSVLAHSPSLGIGDLPRAGGKTEREVELPNDRDGRAVMLSFTPKQEEHDERKSEALAQPVGIMVAASTGDVDHTLRLLGWLLTVLCAAAVGVMGAVLWRVVGEGVRPVKKLAGQIESLSETDLDRRLAQAGVPLELTPVVDRLNGLLERLEAAFSREKAFTADVAHELRTPLTGLRMTLEVCRSQPRDSSAYETAIDECRGITDRMEAMVESLLLLARSDAGQVKVERRQVDLAAMIDESWRLFQYRAERMNLKVAFDFDDAVVETDPEKFRIVLHNVLDNAVSYVNPGGQIRIVSHRSGDRVIVEIANTGSAIAAREVPRIFERFWRGDKARSDVVAHCGLGISLSQRLMHLLGGEISVQSEIGGEFIVQLHIPQKYPSAA